MDLGTTQALRDILKDKSLLKDQCYIDGKWVLMEFDAKTASLWHTFDEKTASGKHRFEVVVTDMKDNVRRYAIDFYK